MAGFLFRLETAAGERAEPPTLTSAMPNWRSGDTIPLGQRTLRVVDVRDDDAEQPPVLVVEDAAVPLASDPKLDSRRARCTWMDERERRLAQNEALFREVNERVESVGRDFRSDIPCEFLCECANPDCTFRISLPTSVYESVRADSTQFIVLPLHYTPEVEDLVAEEETYWVVRKTGEAGDYVTHLDPRNR